MSDQPIQFRHGKSATGFKTPANSLEPRSVDYTLETTPVENFFACNTTDAPYVDAKGWRLMVVGDSVETSLELSYADLLELPQHKVHSWLECAGNGRQPFVILDGRVAESQRWVTHWMLGGIGMASWEGPRLSDVLDLAGIKETAGWIGPMGLDVDNPEGEPIRMSLPIEKAMHPDTLVALTMNGEPLIPAHGFPARLIVPGWIGAYSIKWLDRIEVTKDWVESWRSNSYYVLREPDGTIIGPATSHPVKSNLGVEWNATLPVGLSSLAGCARSGNGTIERIEWSLDGGPWSEIEFIKPTERWAWVSFKIEVELSRGAHEIRTRATDSEGNAQPDEQPFHPEGVLWNAVIPHPVHVQRPIALPKAELSDTTTI
jgi:DMSO/TMAO reductase YedYZ molybdopterin-dependent catalytic subunit